MVCYVSCQCGDFILLVCFMLGFDIDWFGVVGVFGVGKILLLWCLVGFEFVVQVEGFVFWVYLVGDNIVLVLV